MYKILIIFKQLFEICNLSTFLFDIFPFIKSNNIYRKKKQQPYERLIFENIIFLGRLLI